MICISCGNEHEDKFCSNCGEKSNIPKITLQSTIKGTFTTLTNMDKGFLFNIKNLIINPRSVIQTYIKGKRKGVFNPVSFLIITITIYLIIASYFPAHRVSNGATGNKIGYDVGRQAGKFIIQYFKFFWVFTIIPLSLSTKLIFRKYNFMEHVTIAAFILGQTTLIGIIPFLIFRFPLIINPFIYLTLLWFLYRIFKEPNRKWDSFLMAFSSIVFFIISLFTIIVLIGLVNKI